MCFLKFGTKENVVAQGGPRANLLGVRGCESSAVNRSSNPSSRRHHHLKRQEEEQDPPQWPVPKTFD